jgi:hypothetical protein
MFRSLWRRVNRSNYSRDMGIARGKGRMPAVPRPTSLDRYAGQWVAVKDGKVVAHARRSREVVAKMQALGSSADGAVLQRAAAPTDAVAVGLG